MARNATIFLLHASFNVLCAVTRAGTADELLRI